MATQNQVFLDLFHDALKAYQAETKRDIHLETLRKTLKTPEDLLACIESQGESFRNFRNKHGKLWTRMHTVLQPVAAIGAIAQTAINSISPFGPPASAVLGAVLYLVTAADGVKDAYDWVQTLFGEFEMFAIRLQEYVSSSNDLNAALQDRLIAIMTCMLRLFGRAEALIKGGRFREYLRTAFLGKDDKTKGLLDELNVQLKNEQSLIVALTFNATKSAEEYSRLAAESGSRIEDQLDELKLGNQQVIAKLEEQKMNEVSDEQIRDMKQMLETPAADAVARLLSTQKRDLVKGTGGWLEREAHFSTWRSGRAPILWILGGPGAGKSFLATWTILHLQEHFDQKVNTSTETAVAYFFIKDYDTVLLDPNKILKTLALQIAEVDVAFGRHVASHCMSRSATITEDDTWESVFVGFYSSAEAEDHYAVIILDGLDEAPAPVRRKLLAMVKSVIGVEKGIHLGERIQFGIFGRTELRSDLDFSRQEKLIMVSLKNQDDIKTFILSKLPELSLVKVLESKGREGQKQAVKLRNTITKKVLQGADGVFLWAKLLMNELQDLNSVQIGKVLNKPPQSLDGMISKLFHRISQDESVDSVEVSRMMLFICYAHRPLLFGELKLFLSLPNRRPDDLLWRNVRGRFASLFELKYPKWYEPDTVSDNGDDESYNGDDIGKSDGDDGDDKDSGDGEGNDDDDDDDEDNDADFDFGDDGNTSATVYDLGTAPSDEKEAQKYANTIHDSDNQLKTSIRFTHQRIKDFLVADGSLPNRSSLPNEIQVDVGRAEIEMTISCLQALQAGYDKRAHQSYLVDYPARNFVLHLAKVREEHLTTADIREIVVGIVNIFYNDRTAKAIVIATDVQEMETGRDAFWATWIACQTHREIVQSWLRRPEVERIVTDPDTLEWLHKARRFPKVLLEPMIRGASQVWLTKTGYDDEGYRDKSDWILDLLRAFVTMDESGAVRDVNYQDFSWFPAQTSPGAYAYQVYEAAEWAGLEKTTHWHTGVGWQLMGFSYHDSAIDEFDKAIALDSRAWVAMEGKARCLKAQEKYEEAIDLMTRAIENLPASMEQIGSFLYPWIAIMRKELGDQQGAHEAAAKAYAIDKGGPFAQWQYISSLCEMDDNSQAVIDVMDHLHGITDENDCSWLLPLFYSDYDGYEIYEKIGQACRACGTPAFVLEAIDQALNWIQNKTSKSNLIRMTKRAAQFRYHYYSHDSEAVELFEKTLRLMAEKASDGEKVDISDRVSVLNALSLILFDMAVAAKKANQGYSRLSARLKELSIALDSSLDQHSFEFYGTGYPSSLWGRWLRQHEMADERVWRKPFRARLLDQINMLDDDDPANDSYALEAVASTLLHAGDRENAGAILAISFKLLEEYIEERDGLSTEGSAGVGGTLKKDLNTAPEGTTDNEDGQDKVDETSEPTSHELGTVVLPVKNHNVTELSDFIGPRKPTSADLRVIADLTEPKAAGTELELAVRKDAWMYGCDKCGRDAESVAELYFCEICHDKNWCDECLVLVRSDALPRRDCNPDHSFYRAWPIPDEARHAAVVWLEGEPRLRREWLEALRAQWL